MFLGIVGSFGVGMVWGWLAGGMEGRLRHPVRTPAVIALASAAVLIQIMYWAGWRGVFCFLGAGMLAALVQVGWRRELRKRIESQLGNKEVGS